jgi:hypothetical protein
MVDESVRLYSKQPRLPVDVVAPEHAEIHVDLDRWGAWNRERYQPGTCASIEKYFTKGGDTTPPATAPSAVNPRHLQVERAVILAGVHSPQHGECIRQFYVRRSTPIVICRVLVIRRALEGLPTRKQRGVNATEVNARLGEGVGHAVAR